MIYGLVILYFILGFGSVQAIADINSKNVLLTDKEIWTMMLIHLFLWPYCIYVAILINLYRGR